MQKPVGGLVVVNRSIAPSHFRVLSVFSAMLPSRHVAVEL